MSCMYYSDELDILIYNYFNNKSNEADFVHCLKKNDLNYEELKQRYAWLKSMSIDPNVIHLKENHELINTIFDECNKMFNENKIEYYYTSGILSYFLIGKELERYHHDIDVFVNMEDLYKLENVCNNYGFELKRQLGDRNDGTKRVMLKMYYKDIFEIPITIFMYIRNGNSIEQNDYFIRNEEFLVEKIYNSPLAVELSFSDIPKYHNAIKYFAITLEALYLSKNGNREKDIYDCLQFEKNLDLCKLKELETENNKNMKFEVLRGLDDKFYEFIFSEFNTKKKVKK